jgi:hypothetical protein
MRKLVDSITRGFEFHVKAGKQALSRGILSVRLLRVFHSHGNLLAASDR